MEFTTNNVVTWAPLRIEQAWRTILDHRNDFVSRAARLTHRTLWVAQVSFNLFKRGAIA